jgi:hypothetical protein
MTPASSRGAAHLLTRDEARRIAANITKLPDLSSPSTPRQPATKPFRQRHSLAMLALVIVRSGEQARVLRRFRDHRLQTRCAKLALRTLDVPAARMASTTLAATETGQ